MLFGLAGFLWLTPAGFSTATIELEADNVWNPTIFTATWEIAAEGLTWAMPFKLSSQAPVPVNLEIIASHSSESTSGEVWLLEATWPDGQTIPLDEFQTDGNWQQQQVSWGPYENRPVWLANIQGQPAHLIWQGQATGPLTLLFAKHPQAGEVTIRWNGALTQTVNLRAPNLEFQGLTLPLNEPPVWRATLPVSALSQKINLVVEADPNGVFPVLLKKISLWGAGSPPLAVAGPQLAEALQINPGQSALTGEFNEGQITVIEAGVQLNPRHHGKPFQLLLSGPLAATESGIALPPWLENGLIILSLTLLGSVVFSYLAGLTPPHLLGPVNVAIITTILTLLFVEFGLNWYLPPVGRYYVRHPHQQVVFNPKGLMGVSGESRFITNAEGFRGDEFSDQDDYRLLAVGGSTTECLVLDQTETWPQRLQDRLNQNDNQLKVWVGNAGQGGRTTREHIMHLRYLLPQYPSLKAVILMVGINDLALRLSQGEAYDPNYLNTRQAEQELIERAFYLRVNQDPYKPYYHQSAIWRLGEQIWQARTLAQTAKDIDIEDEGATAMVSRRALRKNASIIKDELPDLSFALAEYERNLNTLIDIAQAHHTRLILMTQPTLWQADLSPAEQDLLWFGWGGDREYYYSVTALAEGISRYNQTLLTVCKQRQIECLDLANLLPQDTTIFFDDVHFNESGAEQVAKSIADYLLDHEPFKQRNK